MIRRKEFWILEGSESYLDGQLELVCFAHQGANVLTSNDSKLRSTKDGIVIEVRDGELGLELFFRN